MRTVADFKGGLHSAGSEIPNREGESGLFISGKLILNFTSFGPSARNKFVYCIVCALWNRTAGTRPIEAGM